MDQEQMIQVIRQAIVEFLQDPQEGKTLTACGFTMTWKGGGQVELTTPTGEVQLWQFACLDCGVGIESSQ